MSVTILYPHNVSTGDRLVGTNSGTPFDGVIHFDGRGAVVLEYPHGSTVTLDQGRDQWADWVVITGYAQNPHATHSWPIADFGVEGSS